MVDLALAKFDICFILKVFIFVLILLSGYDNSGKSILSSLAPLFRVSEKNLLIYFEITRF